MRERLTSHRVYSRKSANDVRWISQLSEHTLHFLYYLPLSHHYSKTSLLPAIDQQSSRPGACATTRIPTPPVSALLTISSPQSPDRTTYMFWMTSLPDHFRLLLLTDYMLLCVHHTQMPQTLAPLSRATVFEQRRPCADTRALIPSRIHSEPTSTIAFLGFTARIAITTATAPSTPPTPTISSLTTGPIRSALTPKVRTTAFTDNAARQTHSKPRSTEETIGELVLFS